MGCNAAERWNLLFRRERRGERRERGGTGEHEAWGIRTSSSLLRIPTKAREGFLEVAPRAGARGCTLRTPASGARRRSLELDITCHSIAWPRQSDRYAVCIRSQLIVGHDP